MFCHVFITFPVAMTNYLTRNDLWEKGFIVTYSIREFDPSRQERHGGRVLHGSSAVKLRPLTSPRLSRTGSRKVTLKP